MENIIEINKLTTELMFIRYLFNSLINQLIATVIGRSILFAKKNLIANDKI